MYKKCRKQNTVNTKNNNEIIATLKYGKVISKKVMILLWGMMSILLAFLAFFIAETIIDKDYVVIMILIVIFVFIVIYVCLLVYLNKQKKQIKTWLEDADIVLLDAECEKSFDCLRYGGIRIAVTFVFNGQTITKLSGNQKFSFMVNDYNKPKSGYIKGFNNLVGKKIKILYSPKYDEVLIPIQQKLD